MILVDKSIRDLLKFSVLIKREYFADEVFEKYRRISVTRVIMASFLKRCSFTIDKSLSSPNNPRWPQVHAYEIPSGIDKLAVTYGSIIAR